MSALAKLLTADAKTKSAIKAMRSCAGAWRCQVTAESAVWKDLDLQGDWAGFNATIQTEQGLCLIRAVGPLAENHPKRLRHGGDGSETDLFERH